jgi:hypothetical protein
VLNRHHGAQKALEYKDLNLLIKVSSDQKGSKLDHTTQSRYNVTRKGKEDPSMSNSHRDRCGHGLIHYEQYHSAKIMIDLLCNCGVVERLVELSINRR